MTEPTQYFKGRTVQEQMDEVISYVDKRAEEVAAAKANAVLQPAEQAKTDAQAAAAAAEAAKDTTLAALPEIRQDISGLKAEDTALDGRLDTVEVKVQTAEGNIVTIQGKITAIENKDTQQDSAITALQTADGQNVKINNINQYAVGLTGNQDNIAGKKVFLNDCTGTSYFGLTNKRASFSINDRSTKNRSWFRLLEDINGITLVRGFYDINEDGTNQFTVSMDIDVGGTTKSIEVIGIVTDASGVVTRVSVGGRSIA